MSEQLMKMFPRGPGPLITFMIPSRGRPASLQRAVRSIYNLAKDKSAAEIMVKLDDDDPESIIAAQELIDLDAIPVMVFVTPRGRGFYEMTGWANMMASYSRADWIALLNDDAYLTTKDWDHFLLHSGIKAPRFGFESVFLFRFQHSDEPGAFAWPCLRRKVVSILGHYAPVLASDLWLNRLLTAIGSISDIPIEIKHERLEHEGGETRQGISDANEVMNWQTMSLYGLRAHVNEMNTLVTWLEWLHGRLQWTDKPQSDGWYWWRMGEVANEFFTYVKDGKALLLSPTMDGENIIGQVDELKGQWAKQESPYREDK